MRDKPLFITSVIFFILYLVFLVSVFSPLRELFSPFVTAFAFVYFLLPAVKAVEKLKINPVLATILVYTCIVGLLLFAVLFAVPKIYEAVLKIREIIVLYFEKLGIDSVISDSLTDGINKMYSTVVSAVKSVMTIVVGAVAAFYLLSDRKPVKNAATEFVPIGLKEPFKILADDVKLSLDSFFKGQLVIAGILFCIDTVFLYVMGIPYAVGLGFIAAVLDIIPYAGAFVAMAVILLVTLVNSPGKVIIVLIGLLIIQQIENNIITPKISSDTLELHPAVTILALYVGAFGGFWGILLAIPLSCIFKKIMQRLIQSII